MVSLQAVWSLELHVNGPRYTGAPLRSYSQFWKAFPDTCGNLGRKGGPGFCHQGWGHAEEAVKKVETRPSMSLPTPRTLKPKPFKPVLLCG